MVFVANVESGTIMTRKFGMMLEAWFSFPTTELTSVTVAELLHGRLCICHLHTLSSTRNCGRPQQGFTDANVQVCKAVYMVFR